MKNSMQVLLESAIEHHGKNGSETVYAIEIKAPTNRLLNQITEIERAFMKAATSFKKEGDVTPESTELTDSAPSMKELGDGYVSAMIMAGIDLKPCYEALRHILLESATVEGVKFTSFHYDQMIPSDTSKILGEYIANFTRFSQKN